MSDVMNTINKCDPLEESLRENNSFSIEGLNDFRDHYPILRDHIGELHSAIARLKGEHKTGAMSEDAFDDLFELLPTDWAGEME